VWAWPANGELLDAMTTSLIKRPASTLLLISTAAAVLDSPLGRLRARAMAQPDTARVGPVVESPGALHWIEWSLPDDVPLDDFAAISEANPVDYIGSDDLRRQAAAVPPAAFAQAGRHRLARVRARRGHLDRCRRRRRTVRDGRRLGQRQLARRLLDLPRRPRRPPGRRADPRWPASSTSAPSSSTRGGSGRPRRSLSRPASP
jgi:hypothetical protein